MFLVAVSLKRNDQPIRQFERGFNRIRQPGQQFIIIMPDDQAINNDVDIVLALLVEGGEVIHLHHLTINAGALIAAGLHGHQLFPVFTLAATDNRGQQVNAGAVIKPGDGIDHLADRLALDRQAGGGGIGDPDPGPEQAHVIVDFGDGANG
ncbi:MAG: Uncharacterised protein [SAR116 cluster bacterium MED-G04]|nr:MAG: Uncharacterised protein [SAR116 cluster bacterium MED-G04]